MCRSIISLSKTAHQMWHNHPFSERNNETERALGLGLEAAGKGDRTKLEKGGGVGNIG